MSKDEKSRIKVEMANQIIEARKKKGIATSEAEEIELWGKPRGELRAMLAELSDQVYCPIVKGNSHRQNCKGCKKPDCEEAK